MSLFFRQKIVEIAKISVDGNYAAFAPEVLGCVSTGKTIVETQKNMAEALTGHLELMLEDGESLDSITGKFPATEADSVTSDEEYFALVHVDPVEHPVKAGVYTGRAEISLQLDFVRSSSDPAYSFW